MKTDTLIHHTLRVPLTKSPADDGTVMTRQLDAALLSVGFTLSDELLDVLAHTEAGAVLDLGIDVLRAVRALVGDHVRHNVYFRDFPANVPDTLEFWASLMLNLVRAGGAESDAFGSPLDEVAGRLNLLALPGYGVYQHTYEQMAAAHAAFLPSAGDRVTVLHRGDTPEREATALYLRLASSPIPLSEADQNLLGELAEKYLEGPQPNIIPVRENRALVNRIRLTGQQPLLVDTITDVLRLACALSDGDVTLRTPTKFRSLSRSDRAALLAALDTLVGAQPVKLTDVHTHREAWKRLSERLHPHEYELPHAQRVFAAARGEAGAAPESLVQRMERLFEENNLVGVVYTLRRAPGLLARNLDRLLRHPDAYAEDVAGLLAGANLAKPLEQVSGRVLLSLYEHLLNRTGTPLDAGSAAAAGSAFQQPPRIFTNQEGRAWVTPDTRRPVSPELLGLTKRALEIEIGRRMPYVLTVESEMRHIALPLSGRNQADGFHTLPRGSRMPVPGPMLRLFTYWRQHQQRTDFDLSLLLLDADFQSIGHVSYTHLSYTYPGLAEGIRHSGDITQAPDGASEFIDITLAATDARYLVPQVNVYCGEGFAEVAESFFGFMAREPGQEGLPFEPRTVRTRSDLRGAGQVALPLVFAREPDNFWTATWTHLYLKGMARMNQVEANRLSTALLMRAILGRQYLTLGLLADIQASWPAGELPAAHVALERPDDLPADTVVYTPENLAELIPQ